MRRGFILCIVILFLLFNIGAEASFTKNKPDWLTGVLVFNTMGRNEDQSIGCRPVNQYVFAMDFDHNQMASIEILSNSKLLKDPENESILIVNSNTPGLHADEYSIFDEWRILNCQSLYINKLSDTNITTSEEIHLGIGDFPLSVLSLSVSSEGDTQAFYWRSSYDSNLWKTMYNKLRKFLKKKRYRQSVVQLVKDTGNVMRFDHKVSVIMSFDSEYPLQDIEYAFSNNGEIAIKDAKGKLCVTNDTHALLNCPENEWISGAVCWLDNDKIIYSISHGYDWTGELMGHTLHIWDTRTGDLESLACLWGGSKCVLNHNPSPASLSVNREHSLLAIYIPGYSIGGKECGIIKIISLNNGESYDFIPWAEDLPAIDYSDEPGKAHNRIFPIDPTDCADLQLIWD